MGDDGGSAPKYQCDKCLKTFACWMQKNCHQQKKTCHYCNKNYISQKYFDKHVEICGAYMKKN